MKYYAFFVVVIAFLLMGTIFISCEGLESPQRPVGPKDPVDPHPVPDPAVPIINAVEANPPICSINDTIFIKLEYTYEGNRAIIITWNADKGTIISTPDSTLTYWVAPDTGWYIIDVGVSDGIYTAYGNVTVEVVDTEAVVPDTLIVFVSDENGIPNLWMMKTDGTGKMQLTNHEHRVLPLNIALSHDGKTAYYVIDLEFSQCQIYSVDILTGDGYLVKDGDCADGISMSPNTNILYYDHGIGSCNRDAWSLDLSTGITTNMYDGPEVWSGKAEIFTIFEQPKGNLFATFCQNGCWSPTTEIVVFSPDLTTIFKITEDGLCDNHVRWSNDGLKIAWRKDYWPGDPEEIWVSDYDGSNASAILHMDNGEFYVGNWLPDDEHIILGYEGDLYLLNVDSGTFDNITNTPSINESNGVWVIVK